ncbi:MAG TPA: 2TM domain-containing protein [Nodosilinea sp.]|nr:2TM domain-containing protein [Nodosilinea sp.]
MADLRTNPYIDPNLGDGGFLYEAEDAQQILSLAIARQTESGALSRSQLLEIADELGLSAADITAAEREWDIKKYELADQQLFDSQRRQRFHHGLSQFVISGSFLLLFLVLTGGVGFWGGLVKFLLYLSVAPWGLKLSWDAWRIYRPNEYGYRKEFERWRRKQQLKRALGGAMRRLLGSS